METILKAHSQGRTFLREAIPTPAQINKNFIIRWRHSDEDITWSRLIGAGKYAEKFGSAYMETHFEKAMNSGLDTFEVKIRGLYIITFVSR